MKEVLVCFSVVFLCSSFILASDVFTLNCAESVILGKYGSSVILPCWLTPEVSAETLEIRWYRPEKFTAPFQFYQGGKFNTEYQGTYGNRSSLSPRNPQSTGLKQGDVSLRLDNIGLSDIGIFHCYVSGDKSYQDKTVNLSLTALGAPARLSLQHLQDSVNLTCSSCGWFPQPKLLWKSPNEKTLSKTQSLIYSKQENGLFCAHSWIVLSSSFSNLISCSVTLSEEEKREVSFDLDARPSDDTSGLWKILFGLALFCLLALIGVGLYKIYSARKKSDYMLVNGVEMEVVVDLGQDNISATNLEDLRKDAVAITLDKKNCKNEYLRFIDQDGLMVRDTPNAAENYAGHGFPYGLCVSGSNTLQSGRAFWEVELKRPNVPIKKSWLIGVAKAPCTIHDNKSDYTQSNGFWFLYSDPEKGLRVNSKPEVSLVVKPPPERIGVLLDLEKHELAFYNLTKDMHLLTTLKNLKGDLVPLFNPGIGDESSLTIIKPKVKTQNQSGESGGDQASNANQH